jgi:hypothetical protein
MRAAGPRALAEHRRASIASRLLRLLTNWMVWSDIGGVLESAAATT